MVSHRDQDRIAFAHDKKDPQFQSDAEFKILAYLAHTQSLMNMWLAKGFGEQCGSRSNLSLSFGA